MGRASADLWVQVRRDPKYSRCVQVVKATKRRPTKPEPGAIVVRVAVDVPLDLFSLSTVAVVTVDDG